MSLFHINLTALPSLLLSLLLLSASAILVTTDVYAIPLYARRHDLTCNSCHQIVPTLNQNGLQYLNRGYRLPEHMEDPDNKTIPLAVWYTLRHDNQTSNGVNEEYIPKVELISGGSIGEQTSYFIEWRLISLAARSDGSLSDRSGRFEDAFVNWQPDEVQTFTLGQYRTLQQVDVSRRQSISEPLLFSASLPGDPAADNSRITSLRAFSPSGRDPGITYNLQLFQNEKRNSDGLFLFATLPLVGELSMPLTEQAKTEASFELEAEAKGVFLEAFYQYGLSSVGVHGFIDNDRYLLTGVGVFNHNDLFITTGIGVDNGSGREKRIRSSGEFEYLVSDYYKTFRPGLGFRMEHITGSEISSIPYFVMSGPNEDYTFLLQFQYRIQERNNGFFIDISAVH